MTEFLNPTGLPSARKMGRDRNATRGGPSHDIQSYVGRDRNATRGGPSHDIQSYALHEIPSWPWCARRRLAEVRDLERAPSSAFFAMVPFGRGRRWGQRRMRSDRIASGAAASKASRSGIISGL